jgi:acyl carrier protein
LVNVTASAAQKLAADEIVSLGLDRVVAEIAIGLMSFRKGDAAITADTDIARDLTIDSLAMMDLLMELEDKFDVSIPLNLVPEITTVGELARTIIAGKKGM